MKRFKSYIYEASLSGKTTKYKDNTGAWYQYVELNPELKTLKLENDSFLFELDGTPTKTVLKKGTELEIVGREVKTLLDSSRSKLAHMKYKGKDYRVPTSKLLKPSGKEVAPIEADLTQKEDPNVFTNFKAGHGHEGQFIQRWINSSGTLWEFEYKGKEYRITNLSAPTTKTVGNPKTDVVVELDKKIPSLGTNKLYYSLKDANATYFENWILPKRFVQIFGSSGKKHIEDAYAQLNKNNKIGRSGYKSISICPFVKSKPYNHTKLTKSQNMEVLSGANKFGKTDATANCFFAGTVPETIAEIIDGTITVKDMASKINVGLDFRGSNDIKNSSVFIKNDEGGWDIRENWIGRNELKLDKNMGQSK